MHVYCVIVTQQTISSTFFKIPGVPQPRYHPIAEARPKRPCCWRCGRRRSLAIGVAWNGCSRGGSALIPAIPSGFWGVPMPRQGIPKVTSCAIRCPRVVDPSNWWHDKCLVAAMVWHTWKAFRMEPEHGPNRRITFKPGERWRFRCSFVGITEKNEEQCEIEQAPTCHEAFARRPECSSGDVAASSTLRSHA